MIGSLAGPGGRFSRLLFLFTFPRQNHGRTKKTRKVVMTVKSQKTELELRNSEKISMVMSKISETIYYSFCLYE